MNSNSLSSFLGGIDEVNFGSDEAKKGRCGSISKNTNSFDRRVSTTEIHYSSLSHRSTKIFRMSLTFASQADALRKRTFPWEKLPFEIREEIFKNVNEQSVRGLNYFWWDGVMSPLIIALRSQPFSYQHVLQWFAKENFYFSPLYPTPKHPMMDLTKDELAVIRTASIDIRYVEAI